ncbi:MAG: hypothetical protein HZA89_02950 [Verrucomicrobia bacterium]|nr:hypothetical protein [Verrucomicrobiota bacterium]
MKETLDAPDSRAVSFFTINPMEAIMNSETTTKPNEAVPTPNWRQWMRRLLVCNPFFLCSAALLLFGVDKLSGDPGFLDGDETRQLLFAFFALQIYELIVVGTAVALARRQIWYDSALLTVLDHGLALVPFMMMSQAVLTSWSLTTMLTLGGGVLAASRAAAVRTWNPRFNLPQKALALGGALLLLNLALPVAFRLVIKEDFERWTGPNLFLWLFLLPLLAASANLLPRPARYGGLGPERHWLPLFIFGLWLAASSVHVWCVGYVAHLPLQLHLLAPLACVCTWTMANRISDCLPEPSRQWRGAMLLLVFGAPLFALDHPEIFFPLAALNFAGFAILWHRAPKEFARSARSFTLSSVPLLVAGMPQSWLAAISPVLAGVDPIAASVVLFVLGASLHSMQWQAGTFGALAAASAAGGFYPHEPMHAATQAGLVFLFIHSLRWVGDGRADHSALRWGMTAAWIGNAWMWMHGAGWPQGVFTMSGAVLVALAALTTWWRWRLPVARSLMVGCAGVMLAGPGNWFLIYSRPGQLALAASLLLFAVGIALALTRHRWERCLHQDKPG